MRHDADTSLRHMAIKVALHGKRLNTSQITGSPYTLGDDPRITGVGKVIRSGRLHSHLSICAERAAEEAQGAGNRCGQMAEGRHLLGVALATQQREQAIAHRGERLRRGATMRLPGILLTDDITDAVQLFLDTLDRLPEGKPSIIQAVCF